jgi:integrase
MNTKRGADQHERQLRRRLREGSPLRERARPSTRHVVDKPPPDRARKEKIPTFAAFASEFMATYAKANNKPSEQATKRSHLKCHLLPAFGAARLDHIDTRAIERLKAKMLDGSRSRKRVNNILGTLGKILNYAAEIRLVERAPRVKLLKTEDRPVVFLDFDQYEALVSGSESDPLWHAAILLGGDAGLRLGEIRALRPGHWLRERGVIDVQRSIWRDQETSTKGWKRRTIPLTERLTAALTRLDGDSQTYLVSDHRSAPLRQKSPQWHLPRMCHKAGIGLVGWHGLRHTFCSHLAMLGVPPRTIQELAGHSDLRTTLRYMHLVPGEKDRAIEILNQRAARTTRLNDDSLPGSGNESHSMWAAEDPDSENDE